MQKIVSIKATVHNMKSNKLILCSRDNSNVSIYEGKSYDRWLYVLVQF